MSPLRRPGRESGGIRRTANALRLLPAYRIWQSLWSARHPRAFVFAWGFNRASAVFALSLLASCAVGPNYKRPAVESPGEFRAENAGTNAQSAELAWWQVYQDHTLQS